ncbi:HRDC domain-containing protein [Tessaracoccus lubricantis]|uniref:HRDC domain-containing protein n=1 Tax=Tessaracoccus lubricantis TaxID=545543 RepID=UPI0031E5FAC2
MNHSREPLRPVVDTPELLTQCLGSLRAGRGPVAFDTERAHGHRYWAKAYLLQIRREGSGTWLIDPVAFEDGGERADLASLVEVCGTATWIVHAATQDLPCMQEINIIPPRIFDTELAARLLAKPGASLGALLEAELGIKLRKAHSADNWSRRPLPESWLIYAALDVDYLIELSSVLATHLVLAGRAEWSAQENDDMLARHSQPPVPREDPWRRLSGLTNLRTPLQYAVARELWLARDDVARRRDRPPSWILHDSAILAVAALARDEVPSERQVTGLAGFASQPGQRYVRHWLAALDRVRAMSPSSYPAKRLRATGVPHPRSWDKVNPEAAARWAAVRPVVDELACDLGGLQPSLIAPPAVLQEALFNHAEVPHELLVELGARPWQADFLAPAIAEALGQD